MSPRRPFRPGPSFAASTLIASLVLPAFAPPAHAEAARLPLALEKGQVFHYEVTRSCERTRRGGGAARDVTAKLTLEYRLTVQGVEGDQLRLELTFPRGRIEERFDGQATEIDLSKEAPAGESGDAALLRRLFKQSYRLSLSQSGAVTLVDALEVTGPMQADVGPRLRGAWSVVSPAAIVRDLQWIVGTALHGVELRSGEPCGDLSASEDGKSAGGDQELERLATTRFTLKGAGKKDGLDVLQLAFESRGLLHTPGITPRRRGPDAPEFERIGSASYRCRDGLLERLAGKVEREERSTLGGSSRLVDRVEIRCVQD